MIMDSPGHWALSTDQVQEGRLMEPAMRGGPHDLSYIESCWFIGLLAIFIHTVHEIAHKYAPAHSHLHPR
jgi:hypothetical protein